MPLKVEIEHRVPHEIKTYHHILTDEEVEGLIDIAGPKMGLSSSK